MHGSYSDIGIAAPDVAEVLMDFPSRRIASVHLDFFQKPRRRYIELLGTEGIIRVEYGDWNSYEIQAFRSRYEGWATETHETERDEMFRAEDAEFLSAIVEQRAVRTGVEEGIASIEVLEKAYVSDPELAFVPPGDQTDG